MPSTTRPPNCVGALQTLICLHGHEAWRKSVVVNTTNARMLWLRQIEHQLAGAVPAHRR
jgi:hypothetical protein